MGVTDMQNVSGALNPLDKGARLHAKQMYESIRKQSNDVYYISRNTSLSYERVSLIKGHIFFNKHVLPTGVDRFYPSYEMAESWRRLSSKNGKGIQKHDIIMLYHELSEIEYILRGCSQQEAHERANMQYDYGKASNAYYRSLGFKI